MIRARDRKWFARFVQSLTATEYDVVLDFVTRCEADDPRACLVSMPKKIIIERFLTECFRRESSEREREAYAALIVKLYQHGFTTKAKFDERIVKYATRFVNRSHGHT